VPCCITNPFPGGDPFVCIMADDAQACLDLIGPGTTEAFPGPEGRSCEENGGCWHCSRLDDPVGDTGCCYDEGEWSDAIAWRLNCVRCRGEFMPEGDCRQPPEPECVERGDDRAKDGRRTWTVDLFGTVAIGIDEEIGFRGMTRFITSHMTRATAQEPGTDPCGHAEATPVVVGDRLHLETCSRPSDLHDDSTRANLAAFGTAQDDSELQDGYAYAYGNVALPRWTEVMYRSYKARCRGIPV
jgi:hypothetical protein